ncbi:putative Methyltransferase [Legionella hackeliae]|uniref:Methyltransferase n=3 Tax=Legionella hackeliae TaxID=449 RepID=A0A0A8UR69_LEGHA|nr:methyltransferase [Legionella hackeliae]CEK09264.1 Methyltransferase [Legionella hackeliae]STX49171.1 putative Methyltransferase [Legionella hackeliae]
MDFADFCEAIKSILTKTTSTNFSKPQLEANNYFLYALARLMNDEGEDEVLKMTRLSILFEGFYQSLAIGYYKQNFLEIRIKRWSQHYGTPTVPFLLSFKEKIDQTKQLFIEPSIQNQKERRRPWFVNKQENFKVDEMNKVIINPLIPSLINTPSDEIMGTFTKTYNPLGGFTTAPCDEISQKFIEHAALISQRGGKVLEIGAAFGAATLAAITKGATVFCNDISAENLAVVRNRSKKILEDEDNATTADHNRLVLIPGEFPNELSGLPEKSFDAILICRVLHFFTGSKIEEALVLMSKLLVPGGKIYIVCETPYLKNWQRFIPEFNRRVENNIEWPGEITNPSEYESSGRVNSLPSFVHWITREVLERSLIRTGFTVKHSMYINRCGQFPEDLLLPECGKESVGAIGINESDGL